MAITAYKIVRSSEAKDLERRVNAALADDYVPLGGITIDQQGYYCQVMVVETA